MTKDRAGSARSLALDADTLGAPGVLEACAAVIRMAQSRPLFAALLAGSFALHVFTLVLLDLLEKGTVTESATRTSTEIPVELVSDPTKAKGEAGRQSKGGPSGSQSKAKRDAKPEQPAAASQPAKPAAKQAVSQPLKPAPTPAAKQAAAQAPPPAAKPPVKEAARPQPPAPSAQAQAAKPQAAKPPPPAEAQAPRPAPAPVPVASAPKPPSAIQPPPLTPPQQTAARPQQGAAIPTMATLQMQANHPSAANLPFSMEENYQAVAVPSPSANGDEVMNYKTLVFSMLELAKQFPADARARGAHGTATIYFEIDDNGRVKTVKLLQSSGDTELDVESLAVVERAAPFPKPPPGAQKAFAAEIEFEPGER